LRDHTERHEGTEATAPPHRRRLTEFISFSEGYSAKIVRILDVDQVLSRVKEGVDRNGIFGMRFLV
jgi:hypothetical protein